jgi:hypothetical protein
MDEQPVTVFCFKEPDYVVSIMSTYGTVMRRVKKRKEFSTTRKAKSKFAPFLH